MARGVNKVILLGNLGQDPELRVMPSGNQVANLRLATSDTWTDKSTGQRQERTEWHSLVMFDRLAEVARDYLKKGSRVYIEGRLQTRKWQDQNGQDRYSTEVRVMDMQMLDSRDAGQERSQSSQSQQPNPNQGGRQPSAPQAQQAYSGVQQQGGVVSNNRADW